jgi:hypothetical protein
MNTATMAEREVERLAWVILLSSLVICVLLTAGVPLGSWYFANYATNSHDANLVVLNGTALVEIAGREPSGERNSRPVPEGATIRTDANTRLLLTLFDGSTVFIFPNTQVVLSAMRTPRFELSSRHAEVRLDLRSGRLRLNTLTSDRPTDVLAQTPHAQAQFQLGSYQIETTASQTEIIVRQTGAVLVKAREAQLHLNAQERSVIKTNEAPQGPLPLLQDLVLNGYFVVPLTTTLAVTETWRMFNDQGGDAGGVDGKIEVAEEDGRRTVRLTRQGSNGNHNATVIEQLINQDVSNVDMVVVSADVRLFSQSLPSGGQQSSEFPLMIRVWYVDEFGGINSWVHGFYYQPDPRFRVINGEQIPKDLWYPYESPDIRNSLKPRPARITAIQVYASGWDYRMKKLGELRGYAFP